jgi:ferredoxin
MAYVVTENCVRCKYMDCVEVCPVDCFYEGETMLVIHPDECIDCGVCEPECPAGAISPDGDSEAARWIDVNAKYAALWPSISIKRHPPVDRESFDGLPDKYKNVSRRSRVREIERLGTPLAPVFASAGPIVFD